jgi:hypothetical protein
MTASRRATTVDDVCERLAPDFGDLPPETVRRVVCKEYDALIATHVHIYLYIPNLVEHEARERLTALVATPPRTA